MKFISSIGIACALAGLAALTASKANASATGCDNRQYFEENAKPNAISAEIRLPYGYLCHLIHTRGKEITEQKAAYTKSAGINGPLVKNICNWRLDFVYYDMKGNEYIRDKGETVGNCEQGASRKAPAARTLPQFGTTCAELIIDGEARLTQCHTIRE
jgi:hypothetical protein